MRLLRKRGFERKVEDVPAKAYAVQDYAVRTRGGWVNS